MRQMAFIIFFSIVLTVYGAVNYYIYSRGIQALPAGSIARNIFPYLFWFLAATYVIGRFMERIYLSQLSDALVWTGSFWLAGMLYFFLAVVLIDLVRLVNYIIPFYPSIISNNMAIVKTWLFGVVVGGMALTVLLGHINTLHPVVRKIHIPISKSAGDYQNVNAVVLSDIHLGTIIGNGHFGKIVDSVQALNPDIILLAGDVVDEDLEPVLRQNIGETLRKLSAPLGVYAVMGNHEYIGGAEPAYRYLSEHGIKVLRDTVIKVDNSFYLAGREDRDKLRFSGKDRKPLAELLGELDPSVPLILMDHQPYYPEKAAELGVDLQLSGHTHHGQMWPLNYVTSAIFTFSRGYGKIGNTHFYVSNGIGTWGPPVRIGSRSEIIQLNLVFGK